MNITRKPNITPRALWGKLKSFMRFPFVLGDFMKFKKMKGDDTRFPLTITDCQPKLHDNTGHMSFDRHYMYHPAWAARVLAETKPEKHIDISSVMTFPQLVSAFVPMDYYDYRPADIRLENLHCGKADLVDLPFEDNSIASLSCMHTVEHVGLGRYGDPIDPEGDIKAMKELSRVVAPGGDLLFVVPIGGNPRIQFNAHRIYTYDLVMEAFKDMELHEFALIPDSEEDGDLVRHASKELSDKQRHGCGCFWFKKKA